MATAAIDPRTIHGEPVARAFRPSVSAVLGLLAIAVLWFILCRQLSLEWSGNDQYSYGWFVPFFALYLFWLRWEDRPDISPHARDHAGTKAGNLIVPAAAVLLLALLLPIRLLETAAPDWRPVTWLHAFIVVALTLAVVWRTGGRRWLWHFAFPIAFILVAVPWLAGVEVLVVQGLMRIVAVIAAEALSLFGIPAQLEGNLLRLRTGLVGVNEACSGIRSLQTSLMIGLLFGELHRLTAGKRISLVVAAAAIAFLGNVGRAFFLVWIAASRGIDATEQWHDTTGYAIVGIVFFGTMAVASFLAGKQPAVPNQAASKQHAPDIQSRSPRWFRVPALIPAAVVTWLVLAEAAVEGWYRYHERDLVTRQGWTVRWPESAPKYRVAKLDERMSGILRFDEGRGASWALPGTSPQASSEGNAEGVAGAAQSPMTCVLYFFRWTEGRSSILRARGHRPDVCLPSVGWGTHADYGTRTYSASQLSLPFRHFEFRRGKETPRAGQVAHAFFCVGEDLIRPGVEPAESEQEISERQGLSLLPELWRLVRSGMRPHGQQVMQVILVSPKPISVEEATATFGRLLGELVVTDQQPS